MWNYQADNRTENERYLEEQLERERQWRQEEEDMHQQYLERQRNERKQMYEQSLRMADNWLEALEKQSQLCWREADGGDVAGNYFKDTSEACDWAIEIWPEESAKVQDEIEKLEKKIAELRESVRFAVGNRLANHERHGQDGWRGVANILLDPAEDPESWLNW